MLMLVGAQGRYTNYTNVSKTIVWTSSKNERLPNASMKMRQISLLDWQFLSQASMLLGLADMLEISGMMPREANDTISQQNEFMRNLGRSSRYSTSPTGIVNSADKNIFSP
jgi:hypothetical protein